MKKTIFSAGLFACLSTMLVAAPLTEGTFTDVIKQVSVVDAQSKATAPAAVNAIVKAPDLVRTGPESRAELTAPDNTITRVGANTVFSFEPEGRSIRLEQGSVLFHSPKGKGGGTIKSGGASAAVLGTTVIVVAMADGRFKFFVLEGSATATVAMNGSTVTVNAGQMALFVPGAASFQVLDIDLGQLIGGSQLVNGFSQSLPSLALIEAEIKKQAGIAQTDGTQNQPGDGNQPVDNTSLSTIIVPLIPPGSQFGEETQTNPTGQGIVFNPNGGFQAPPPPNQGSLP